MRVHLFAVLIGFALIPGIARTQEQFELAHANEVRHGSYVKLALKAKKEVMGTVVRRDAGKIYIRTKPGMPAEAIAENDIADLFKKTTKASPFRNGDTVEITLKGQKPRLVTVASDDVKKGRVIFAIPGVLPMTVDVKDIQSARKIDSEVSFAGAEWYKHVDVTAPEIQPLVIINGNRRSVAYHAPSLSPGEQTHLISLQAAENEMGRLDELGVLQMQVLNNAIAIQTEQKRTLELLNYLLLQQTAWGYHGSFYPLPTIYPQAPIATPKVDLPADALTAARQNLQVARNRAVFEQGQLVAVIDK